MEERLTVRADIERVLADPSYGVPAAPEGDRGVAWLRSTVSRFVNGPAHERRRALVVTEIDALDPAALRADARRRADAVLDTAGDRVEVMRQLARPVPLATLGHAIGIADADLDGAVADATVVGPAYLSGAATEAVDAAVERLRSLLDRGAPEETAAAIAVLAQACDATAGLVGNAIAVAADRPDLRGDVDALLDTTLLGTSPVRLQRRVSAEGGTVTLDLEAASAGAGPAAGTMAFGSGVRPCPGAAQACAAAAGVLDAVLPRCAPEPVALEWSDSPALKLPTRLELAVG